MGINRQTRDAWVELGLNHYFELVRARPQNENPLGGFGRKKMIGAHVRLLVLAVNGVLRASIPSLVTPFALAVRPRRSCGGRTRKYGFD